MTIRKNFTAVVISDDNYENDHFFCYAVFPDFSYTPIYQLKNDFCNESEVWWAESPLRVGLEKFDSNYDFEVWLLTNGKGLLPTSFVLERGFWGHYGSGNWNEIVKIFRDPKSVLEFSEEETCYKSWNTGAWERETQQVFHIIDCDDKKYACTKTTTEDYGGRG